MVAAEGAGGAAPWEKLEGESPLQFSRFERFRSLGPSRTLEAAYRAETGRKGVAPGHWRESARKYRWRERAEAWDAEQTRQAREEEGESLAERRKAWIAQAMDLQAAGAAALLKLQAQIKATPDHAPPPMTARDIAAYLDQGVKLEMLARGEPTETHEHVVTTPEQRRGRVLGILARLRERARDNRAGDAAGRRGG